MKNKLIIEIEFESDSDLLYKLEILSDDAADSVYALTVHAPYGIVVDSSMYRAFLVPEHKGISDA